MTHSQTQYFRAELAERRAALRHAFAEYRTLAAQLTAKGLVSYNKKSHTFARGLRVWTGHQMKILETFTQLQRELQEQAWLLVELEYTIDEQETKTKNT